MRYPCLSDTGVDMVAASELPINTLATAFQMAQSIFGSGVTVNSASYTGDARSSGIYSNGNATSPGVVPSDTGVILSTGRVTDFTNTFGQSNQSTNTSTNTSGPNNNAMFNAIAGASTYDAAYLDIDFTPTGDTMTMQFVFSSDEFPEYSASVYNDVVGVWINGTHVPLSVGNGKTSVGNVNQTNNINLYKDNTLDQFNTEMDGFTVTMTLTIPVNPGVVNSIRIGIADVVDSNYDSSLLIAGDSVQTVLIARDDDVTIGIGGTKTVDVLANDYNAAAGTLTITQINGVAVTVGSTVTLPTGQVVTLNADGTFTIQTDLDAETVSFTYKIQNSAGQTDVGFVTVDTVPCFVAGTLIRTPVGDVAVESLHPGDLVVTVDDGPQPIRWIGQREVCGLGKLAPIRFEPGALGDHGALLLSPQHRVMIRDTFAELMFGETEVLVAAKDLVNDCSIRPQDCESVTYVHILFDRHQVVWSEGLATESFLPGPQTTKSFDAAVIDEISLIFPELDPQTGSGYGPAARRGLRNFEAVALRASRLAA